MNLLVDAFAWIFDPAHQAGANGIPTRLVQHLGISLLVLVVASAIAIPVGYLIGHTGKGRTLAVSLTGGFRSLPTLGLLIILALWLGVGLEAPLIALIVLAVPPILAGAYSGFEAVDRRTIDAARAVGMTEWQIVSKVEVPLGLPLLIGGLRSGTLQIIATATLADYVGAGGLGHFIFVGQKSNDYPQMLAGSLLVIALALLSEGIFALLQKLVVPRGVVANQNTDVRTSSPRRVAVVGSPTEERK
ncbi:ABC transporter permease [Agreia pratensis]|uniref:Osmoprotectant transport system permease protein n=1 Tax=Agreia pratensis TaxID=150121 RepID=A0A1X7L0Q6_9MICO|nr:ABC transporter permease [Agreia pratensis]MBF4633746.1 ABC transporter permease [Agreia pratensis]SMG47023.1 osmoprotectant transport system permease protein [Agreia pratensis]